MPAFYISLKKAMQLTKDDRKALKPYERYMETALRASWASYPGSAALDTMHAIHARVTGSRLPMNKGCSACIMRLLKELGAIYFAKDHGKGKGQ